MGRGGGRGRTTVACTVAAATTAAPPRAAHLSATPPAFPRARTRGAALPSPTSRPIRRQRPAARASCACCSGRLELPRPPHMYSTAQPRRLLFAGPQTANSLISSDRVHLIDAPHRTPHAPAARTPPAGGRPHDVLAGGDASDVVLPPTARSAGRIAPRRLGCLRAAALARRARRPCASGNRPIRSDLPKTSA